MKKLFTIATLLIFISVGNITAQNKYIVKANSAFSFSDQVRIKVGGASQERSTKEWKNGGKVGNHEIDAATFAKLQAATSGNYTMEIEAKSIGTLHKVILTDVATGKSINGVFDSRKNEFTVGSSKTKQGANGAGKTEIGIIKGKLSADKSTITDGTFEVGFIAGKAPAVITASATFTFSGKLTPIR
jgi:hypothetical protein